MIAKWRKCFTTIAASLRDDIIWVSMYQARTQHNNKRKLSKTSKKKKSATNTPIEPGPTTSSESDQRNSGTQQRDSRELMMSVSSIFSAHGAYMRMTRTMVAAVKVIKLVRPTWGASSSCGPTNRLVAISWRRSLF
uniref:Uncharacterized protein n=1 Tax=Anopheles arabiensis TaxID=7173 RepID=A0A182IH75_ANOAR